MIAPVPQSARPAEEIHAALRDVLARAEFAPEAPSALGEALEELAEWLAEAFQIAPSSGRAALYFAAATLVLLLALLIVWVARPWLARRRGKRGGAETGAAEEEDAARAVSELRARARAARSRGDFALALRLSTFALVLGLSRRGDLEYRDAWTNRELLARGRPSAEVAARLGPLVAELDSKLFGREGPTDLDVARMEALCEQWLGGTP